VRSVKKERDEARCQVQNLRQERLMERLFSEAEGRVGGDERGTFFDTFVTLCGGHFQLAEVDGRERRLPVDGKGQPLTTDGAALSDGDSMEELRRHPVYSFLFQQRSGRSFPWLLQGYRLLASQSAVSRTHAIPVEPS
jgi:hypothetical protein